MSFTLVTRLGMVFERCPKAWLRDEGAEAQQLIADWAWFRAHGHTMPEAGGTLDQDPRFLEAVRELEAAAPKLAEAIKMVGAK